MDKSIYHEMKQVPHVLTPYYYNTMEELSKDLSHALDESSDIRIPDRKLRRNKTWKCRPKSKNSIIYGSNTLKHSTKSEDSESSLDTPQDMDYFKKSYQHHTDSDDIIFKINQQNYRLSSWRHGSINLGESDSVNENLYPSRQPRRKKKFKRMSVDAPSVKEEELPVLSNVTLCTQKNKRLRNLKSEKVLGLAPKLSKISVSQLAAEMQNICKDFGNASAPSGKRKRCAHEKSIESNGCGCKDFISSRNKLSSSCHHLSLDVTTRSHDVSSSSESECGILTNDESREADDEQSDFFQEPGPTYGIPSLSPWSQNDNDDVLSDEQKIFDPDLQDLLSESFRHMSETAKNMYIMQINSYRVERQIRSGQRRLGNRLNPKLNQKMLCSDDLLSCMPVTDNFQGHLNWHAKKARTWKKAH